jgi:pyridoxamine 5'-phosphate oxidase
MNPADLRREYEARGLLEEEAGEDPMALFDRWFKDAVGALGHDANAMVLSTAGKKRPTSRVVLLKGYEKASLVFYTSYLSHKAAEMAENPQVALLFFWHTLERQIRIEGSVQKTSRAESEAYFASRPLESRLGAHASIQSSVIPSRAILEKRAKEAAEKYGESVPCPETWGGYIVSPDRFEFWQGRPARLHDRITYQLIDGTWKRERLSP